MLSHDEAILVKDTKDFGQPRAATDDKSPSQELERQEPLTAGSPLSAPLPLRASPKRKLLWIALLVMLLGGLAAGAYFHRHVLRDKARGSSTAGVTSQAAHPGVTMGQP